MYATLDNFSRKHNDINNNI